MSVSSLPADLAPVVVPAAEGQRVRAFGNEILFKLTGDQTGGALSLGLAVVPPDASAPPLHAHETEDEVFVIVEGTYRVFADGAWSEAGPGDVVFLPRGVPHTFEVVSPAGGRHWVITTSSAFARFYAECGDVFARPGPPDRARLGAIAAAHGMRILAPDATGR